VGGGGWRAAARSTYLFSSRLLTTYFFLTKHTAHRYCWGVSLTAIATTALSSLLLPPQHALLLPPQRATAACTAIRYRSFLCAQHATAAPPQRATTASSATHHRGSLCAQCATAASSAERYCCFLRRTPPLPVHRSTPPLLLPPQRAAAASTAVHYCFFSSFQHRLYLVH
jgi:hypothetical protein